MPGAIREKNNKKPPSKNNSNGNGKKVVKQKKIPKVATDRDGDKDDPSGLLLRTAMPVVIRCSDAIQKVLKGQGVKVDHDVVLNKLIAMINELSNPPASDNTDNSVTASVAKKNPYNMAMDLFCMAFSEKASGNDGSFREYADLAYETEGIEDIIMAFAAYNDDSETEGSNDPEIDNQGPDKPEVIPTDDSLTNGEIDNVDLEDGLSLFDDSDLADDDLIDGELSSETVAKLHELLASDNDDGNGDDDDNTDDTTADPNAEDDDWSEDDATDEDVESDEDSDNDDEEDSGDDDPAEETASDNASENQPESEESLSEAPAKAETLAKLVNSNVTRIVDRRMIAAANRLSLSGTADARKHARKTFNLK